MKITEILPDSHLFNVAGRARQLQKYSMCELEELEERNRLSHHRIAVGENSDEYHAVIAMIEASGKHFSVRSFRNFMKKYAHLIERLFR